MPTSGEFGGHISAIAVLRQLTGRFPQFLNAGRQGRAYFSRNRALDAGPDQW